MWFLNHGTRSRTRRRRRRSRHSAVLLKPTVSTRPSVISPRGSHKCIRFDLWPTLCTLKDFIYHLLYTYLLTKKKKEKRKVALPVAAAGEGLPGESDIGDRPDRVTTAPRRPFRIQSAPGLCARSSASSRQVFPGHLSSR